MRGLQYSAAVVRNCLCRALRSNRTSSGSHYLPIRNVELACRVFSTTAGNSGHFDNTISNGNKKNDSENKNITTFDLPQIREEIFQKWMLSEAQSPRGSTIQARYCCFTYEDARRAYQAPKAPWHWLDRELSSNLAGETGAVYIYQGALAALSIRPSGSQVVAFCEEHMRTESHHLGLFSSIILDKSKHTRLVPAWKIAGWVLGFFPTLLGGSRALYVTVEAIETFVEEHFQEQIIPLQNEGSCPKLVKLLEYCCADEVHHKEDAAANLLKQYGGNAKKLDGLWWVKPWRWVVQTGSSAAAEVARRV